MRLFLSIFCFCAFICGCTKNDTGSDCPTVLKLSITNATPTVGTDFTITAPDAGTNTIYSWYGPGGLISQGNYNKVVVNTAKYSHRGWYYCSMSTSCNSTLHDSVYVNVKLQQETPPCTLTNNLITCSNIVNLNATSVTKGFDPTFNGMALYGQSTLGYPSFRILFNSYNGHSEPIDGTYNTTNTLTFDVTQEYNDVSVSFLYSGIFFHCWPNQKLYVTHVGGKLQIAFCSMVFSSGSTPTTTCSGKLTEQ